MTYKEYRNRTIEQIIAEEAQRERQLEIAKQAQLALLGERTEGESDG